MNRWPGKIIYLSGGTTGSPSTIVYDAARWEESVRLKAELMRAHGIGARDRVVVAHPFSPWAIGHVFGEAALACGATVLPVGLTMEDPGVLRSIESFRPTVVCGGPRALARRVSRALGQVRLALVAGELLTPEMRTRSEAVLRAPLVDIYGMAEFDMVAAEVAGIDGHVLVPRFEYGCIADQQHHEPIPGRIGELCIRERGRGWVVTRDRVEFCERVELDSPPWGEVWRVRILGRSDVAVSLSDGSMILDTQVSALQSRFPSIHSAQIAVIKCARCPDRIEIRYEGAAQLDSDALSASLLEISIDVADAVRHGFALAPVGVRVECGGLVETPRGKLKKVVERWED